MTPAHEVPDDLQLLLQQSFLHFELLLPCSFNLLFVSALGVLTVPGCLGLEAVAAETGQALALQGVDLGVPLLGVELAFLLAEDLYDLQELLGCELVAVVCPVG